MLYAANEGELGVDLTGADAKFLAKERNAGFRCGMTREGAAVAADDEQRAEGGNIRATRLLKLRIGTKHETTLPTTALKVA
jgi:hypothetical protein